MDISMEIMRRNGVEVECIRAIDHQIATGRLARHDRARLGRRRVAGDLRAGDGRRHPRARDVDLARREVLGRDPDRRAPLRQLPPAQRRRPVRLLRPRRRLPGHRQRGRRQALRDEHALLAPAPRLHDPAAGRLGLDRRGRARARPTSTRARAAPRTTSPTATPPSRPGTCCTSRGCSRTPAASRPTATSAPSGTRAAASTSRTRSTASALPLAVEREGRRSSTVSAPTTASPSCRSRSRATSSAATTASSGTSPGPRPSSTCAARARRGSARTSSTTCSTTSPTATPGRCST